MTAPLRWWSTWAPYWEHLERRHLTPGVIDTLLAWIAPPCLVVGSGQGLVLEELARSGVPAVGVDLEREMLVRGRARRGQPGILADALELPFRDRCFGTVIVASGVIDYLDDEQAAVAILCECSRVLAPGGSLLAAFYQLHPTLRRINRSLGVLCGGRYHMGRLFEIHETVKTRPLRCVPRIVSWTGRNAVSVFLGFTRLGLFMPRVLREENALIDRVAALAKRDGVSTEELYASVPPDLPYRDAAAARALAASAGFSPVDAHETDDCVVLRIVPGKPDGSGTPAGGPEGASDAILRGEGLVKRFEGASRNAVDGVDIAVRRGAIHGILGPNGAGKSTTIRLLLGLLPADEGRVTLASGASLRLLRADVGYVPQEIALYPKLTARENLAFFGRLYGLDSRRLAARIDAVLDLVGLGHRADDRVSTYSSGMTRRLNLAAGLLHEPCVLFLDEPTVGIDPQSRNRIYGVIEGLRRAGVAILLTTHHMEEASRLCDWLSIMNSGRIVVEGEPRRLVEDHGAQRLEFTAASVTPGLAGLVERLAGVRSARLSAGEFVVRAGGGFDSAKLVAEISRLADEAGARLALRSVRGPDLESLFLDVTGNELDREG